MRRLPFADAVALLAEPWEYAFVVLKHYPCDGHVAEDIARALWSAQNSRLRLEGHAIEELSRVEVDERFRAHLRVREDYVLRWATLPDALVATTDQAWSQWNLAHNRSQMQRHLRDAIDFLGSARGLRTDEMLAMAYDRFEMFFRATAVAP